MYTYSFNYFILYSNMKFGSFSVLLRSYILCIINMYVSIFIEIVSFFLFFNLTLKDLDHF